MRRSNPDFVFLTKQKIAMSSRIIQDRDAEYGWYAGGSFDIAKRMATIDTILKLGLANPKLAILIKVYRAYLNQMRKAYFATQGSTELTKLGFILGEQRVVKRATAPATY